MQIASVGGPLAIAKAGLYAGFSATMSIRDTTAEQK